MPQPLEDQGQIPNSLFLYEEALTPDDCKLIIARFERTPFTEMTEGEHGEGLVAVNEEEECRVKYIDSLGNINYNISHSNNEDFDYIMDKVDPFLPKNDQFGSINFASITKYPVNAFMPPHKDEADLNRTATALILLNDDFEGGQIIIDGHIIYPRTGSCYAFNNPTERWYTVNPVFKGESYVLAILFGYTDDYLEDEQEIGITREQESQEEEVTEQFKTLHLPKTQESDAD
jgi:hypothetical protein